MMSRRISLSLLRNYNHNLSTFNSIVCFSHLHSSLPNLNRIQRLSTPAIVENIQLSKILFSLTQCPADVILSAIDKDTLSGNESVTLLKALREQVLLKGVDGNSFKDHPKFKKLCSTFEKDCYQMRPHLLISGLRSLLEVGVPSNSVCVTSAEEAVIKNVYQFSVFNLIGCLHYHHKFMETSLQKKVVSVLGTELQKRLHEIRSAAEVVMLVRIYHLFDDQHKKEIEQKVIELIPLLDIHDISKVICTLAETSNRNINLLNVMAFYLRLKEKRPELKETIDLCYAFKKLNFFDPKLFSLLLFDLEPKISSTSKPALISGLLAVCGHTKWKHAGILDACGLWIKTHFDVCRTREIVAYILAIGAINHVSFQTKATLNLVLPHLTLENVKANVFLDIAWSLSVVDFIPKELLLEVLSPKFYKPLLQESESQAVSSIKLKLLNLKGILKMKYPECIFGCNLFLEPFKLQESSVIESSRKHVIQVLSNFVPVNKCLNTNQVGDSGVFIDAEFIMDQNKKPIPLQDYGIMSKATTFTKPLPKGAQRIALLVMFHKDFTTCSQSLTGVNALGARLLTAEGYTVVHIHYDDFSKTKTEVGKAKYLLRKINDSFMTS